MTFETAQERLTALQAGKSGAKEGKTRTRTGWAIVDAYAEAAEACLDHMFFAAKSMVATYVSTVVAGSLLTWSVMTLLGQPFTQWPAINAVAKILAVLASGASVSETLTATPSYTLTRHFLNAIGFSLFTYVFLISTSINPCEGETHTFTSILDWVHNRHIFGDISGTTNSQFFPAAGFALGGAALAAALSPLLVKAVDAAKHVLTLPKQRRARAKEMKLLQNILALRGNRDLIRKYFPHHVEEIERPIDEHLTPVFTDQIKKLTDKKKELEALIVTLEATKAELSTTLAEDARKNLIAGFDQRIAILREKIEALETRAINPLKKDLGDAKAIKEKIGTFFGIQNNVNEIEKANAELLAADVAVIETDALIAQTELLREDVARQLFAMVDDAAHAYNAALEIARTEALRAPAPPV